MQERLNVLLINSVLQGGGTDNQVILLARGLLELGVRVLVACPQTNELFYQLQSYGIESVHWEKNISGLYKLKEIIRRRNITLLHAHHGRDYWPTIMAASLSFPKPKVVLSRHMAKSPGSWISQNYLLKHCDCLVAVSQFTRKVLTEGHFDPHCPIKERHKRKPIGGDHEKIKVIYGGIDTGRFYPRNASYLREKISVDGRHFLFGMVGSYDYPLGKGQLDFLEAAHKTRNFLPQGRFLIIGRGNMRELLEEKIKSLSLQDRVFLIPHTPEIDGWLNALDCLVHPAIATEAFGLVILEAFACGKPVIATSLDGIPEAFQACQVGKLIPPWSVPELCQALADVAKAGPLSEEKKWQCHKKIESSFSYKVMAKNMLELYNQLIMGNTES
ncbi:glycosyltransferase family 4 protein [Candidatus Methylacidiphilum infernorum]|uniref:Glycosyltransferase family 4 protein n=1 Tax=Candidatus Methylacidiphilum infernorum TaxID=511746 RepID=A0ABX7PTL9_9BACT|nr:glycosyltransferase family 4 protein [Candidatus Methylacidiphilum infernorum]QSR86247.1 glycosyltransferase family 4 protein [Candidatus Methylacidiphilum infernorum]